MRFCILLAGGTGTRFGGDKPKQYLDLGGCMLIEHSMKIIKSLPGIGRCVVVTQEAANPEIDYLKNRYDEKFIYTTGGESRQESVLKGLESLKKETAGAVKSTVLIHDSARPFAKKVFMDVLRELENSEAVIPGLKPKETLYKIKDGRVAAIPERDSLFSVQTPQGFDFVLIYQAHQDAILENNLTFTDDGSLVFRYSETKTAIIQGDPDNIKITNHTDLLIAKEILKNRKGR